jgi:hypothetical protein
MAVRLSISAMIALVAFPLAGGAAENWGQLKLAALGQPLLRNAGRGFETWTYDHGGELVIYGSLIGWTAPVSATQVHVAARSKDVWSENRNLPYLSFLSLLPPRHPPSPRRRNADANRTPLFYSDFYRR